MPVTPAEAQEFFQQVTAAGSPEEQQALIQNYAANNDNPDEMLAAVVQANPAAAQQIATVTAQAIPGTSCRNSWRNRRCFSADC